jgi:hypothetical protein
MAGLLVQAFSSASRLPLRIKSGTGFHRKMLHLGFDAIDSPHPDARTFAGAAGMRGP